MPTANDILVDRGIRHAVHLHRLGRGNARQVLAFLNEQVLPDLEDKLRRRLRRIKTRGHDIGPWTTKRLREIIATTRAQVAEGMARTGEEVVDVLQALGISEAEWQAARMRQAIPGELDIEAVVPGARQMGAIIRRRPFQGKLLRKWWSELSQKAQRDIQAQIQIGITEGETNAQIIRRLVGTADGRYMDGAFGGLRRNVSAVVQTATNHVSTQAREMTYKANDDIVTGVQIVATLDARTTEICMSEDGKVYPVGEGPRPPFHWNCRTTTAPVLKSLRQMGIRARDLPQETRASMDGQVPARTTYQSWLRRQPASIQDEILGPTKGRLFRKHKLPVSAFVDDKRRILTIPEIREKEGLPPLQK